MVTKQTCHNMMASFPFQIDGDCMRARVLGSDHALGRVE